MFKPQFFYFFNFDSKFTLRTLLLTVSLLSATLIYHFFIPKWISRTNWVKLLLVYIELVYLMPEYLLYWSWALIAMANVLMKNWPTITLIASHSPISCKLLQSACSVQKVLALWTLLSFISRSIGISFLIWYKTVTLITIFTFMPRLQTMCAALP